MPSVASAKNNFGVWHTSDSERRLAHDINLTRFNVGARPMMLHRGLSAVAGKRTASMLRGHYFAHSSPRGIGAWDIIKKMRLRFNKGGGENIVSKIDCRGTKPKRIADQFHMAWVKSRPHYVGMTKKRWNRMGVSISKVRAPAFGPGCYRWVGTLVFARK